MSARRGMALVLALLVLVLIEAMSAGIVTLATQARLVATARTNSLRAETAAEAAVQRVLSNWQRGGFDTLPAATSVGMPSPPNNRDERITISVERLQSATYLIRAEARVGGGHSYARARATAIARTLDRARLVTESNAAIASGGPLVLAAGAVISAGEALPPTWPDSLCPATEPMEPANALVSARAPLIGEDVSITGAMALDSSLARPDSLALGGLRWSELAGIADRLERGAVNPAPVANDTTCVIGGAANWGDPQHADAPCSSYFPLIYAADDLTIAGGAGQGILAVAGTLTITGNFTFVGVIVTRDGATVGAGATVYGAFRSRAGYGLLENSSFTYSRCAVARAAVRTASATRLVLPQRRFIPSF